MKTVASGKLSALFWIFILQFYVQTDAFSQSVLNYQGRVISGGTAFTGTGQFKFAIVSSDGSTFFWKNDGTTTAEAPLTTISLPVNKGLFSVQLGDTGIMNMGTINSTILSNSGLKLRIWFNDGAKGYQQISPDVKLYFPNSSAPTLNGGMNLDLLTQFISQSLSPKFSYSYAGGYYGSTEVICSVDFTVEYYIDGKLFASGRWGDSVQENEQTMSYPSITVSTLRENSQHKYCTVTLASGLLEWVSPHPAKGKKVKWRIYNNWGESSTREYVVP